MATPGQIVAPRPLDSRWVPAPRDDRRIGFLRRASLPRSHEAGPGAPSTCVAKAKIGSERGWRRRDSRTGHEGPALRSHSVRLLARFTSPPTPGLRNTNILGMEGRPGGLPGLGMCTTRSPTPCTSGAGRKNSVVSGRCWFRCVRTDLQCLFVADTGLLAGPQGQPRLCCYVWAEGSEFRLGPAGADVSNGPRPVAEAGARAGSRCAL